MYLFTNPAVLCQFYVKMPLQNLYLFNMGLTPPAIFEQCLKKLQDLDICFYNKSLDL